MTASGDGWRRARVVSSGTLAVATLLFGVLMLRPLPISRTARVAPEQTSIETGLVDLSPSAPSRPAPPTPQAASVPPVPPLAEPQPHHHSHGAPARRRAQAMPENTPASSADAGPPSAEPRPSAPIPDEPARTEGIEGPAGETRAARAVFQPLPELPAELRRHVLTLEAVVRFTIATDGSATPDLEEATPDPQINRILLDTFRRWRFFPAVQNDRPVRSILTLRVPITVK